MTVRALAMLIPLMFGCGADRTEMLVRIFNDGLVVPSDVDSVYFKVTDRDGGVRREQTLQLCRPGGLGQGCFTFPITALLIPGDSAPDSDVAVEVDAVSKLGTTVIANAAKFRFTRATTQHIDFVLYPDCLNKLSCAVVYQACLKNGMCGDPPTGTLDTDMDPKLVTDLGSGADMSMDMSVDLDLSVPLDFSSSDFSSTVLDLRFPGFDLPPPDLTQPDLTQSGGKDMVCTPLCNGTNCNFVSCGVPCTCNGGMTCSGSTCVPMTPTDAFQIGNLDLF